MHEHKISYNIKHDYINELALIKSTKPLSHVWFYPSHELVNCWYLCALCDMLQYDRLHPKSTVVQILNSRPLSVSMMITSPTDRNLDATSIDFFNIAKKVYTK